VSQTPCRYTATKPCCRQNVLQKFSDNGNAYKQTGHCLRCKTCKITQFAFLKAAAAVQVLSFNKRRALETARTHISTKRAAAGARPPSRLSTLDLRACGQVPAWWVTLKTAFDRVFQRDGATNSRSLACLSAATTMTSSGSMLHVFVVLSYRSRLCVLSPAQRNVVISDDLRFTFYSVTYE